MALVSVLACAAAVAGGVAVCLCLGRMAGLYEYEEQTRTPLGRHVPDSTTRGGLWVAEGDAQTERRAHPLYRKLSGINEMVSGMSRGQLKRRLRELNLESR